jgi:hypothetical protein
MPGTMLRCIFSVRRVGVAIIHDCEGFIPSDEGCENETILECNEGSTAVEAAIRGDDTFSFQSGSADAQVADTHLRAMPI